MLETTTCPAHLRMGVIINCSTHLDVKSCSITTSWWLRIENKEAFLTNQKYSKEGFNLVSDLAARVCPGRSIYFPWGFL